MCMSEADGVEIMQRLACGLIAGAMSLIAVLVALLLSDALSPGRLPPPDRASREELEQAEKRHKRLVAWRWLSLRFPEAYPDFAEAEAATDRLDGWIENVLRQQRRGKTGLAA